MTQQERHGGRDQCCGRCGGCGGHDRGRSVADLVEAVTELVACGGGCRCHDGGHGGNGGNGGNGGGGGDGGRPTRQPGTDDGTLGGGVTVGGIRGPWGRGQWPGPRKDSHLPYLFLRAFPGDTGTRPVAAGTAFWESPDVHVLGGVAPAFAPDVPPTLGQTAQAGADNTVYAHVWNLGNAPAREVVVEFYWCDPSLGFNPVGAHLIGRETTWLGDRRSGECHRVVKCGTSWVAGYVNGGHECLLVRAYDAAADPLTTPEWDASVNRHLGQRNIHVVPAGGEGGPVTLAVGRLYGAAATVTVARHAPTTMPWLQLLSGVRGSFPGQAVGTGRLVLATPGRVGGDAPVMATGDDAQVVFGSTDGAPPPGQAHVYRVTAAQGGQVIGGYTVVHQG